MFPGPFQFFHPATQKETCAHEHNTAEFLVTRQNTWRIGSSSGSTVLWREMYNLLFHKTDKHKPSINILHVQCQNATQTVEISHKGLRTARLSAMVVVVVKVRVGMAELCP